MFVIQFWNPLKRQSPEHFSIWDLIFSFQVCISKCFFSLQVRSVSKEKISSGSGDNWSLCVAVPKTVRMPFTGS